MLARIASVARPSFTRAASTAPRGLKSILEKNPEDVVITFAKRTAMGRKGKGQLAQYPIDEILHALFKVRVSHMSMSCS